ncbi:ribonuclease R [Marinicella sediminis]|uniref:Ribonuclease R n=1 Tax=Marinicella sediminis TaxID=1792834 RepID=A0ABV7J490_9GAMM|nr:ribonuclease R [Marinicella sediminis]
MKNPFNIPDPEFSEQVKKYEHPIPSRTALINFLEQEQKLLKLESIAIKIGIQNDDQLEGLKHRLRSMVRDGQLLVNRRGGYGVRTKLELTQGRISAHPDGFGFLVSDELDEDAFITPKQMRSVMDGDVVLADVQSSHKGGGKLDAFIVEVLSRAHATVAGRLVDEEGLAYLKADNSRIGDIMIPREAMGTATHNDYVTVSIKKYPEKHRPAFGEVIAILGQQLNHELSMQLTIVSEGLPHEWPTAVEQYRNQIPTEVKASHLGPHKDIRHLPLVTIDGADARDFDDAVYAEPTDNGYKLLVAIADVSTYVRPEYPLDKEAFNRGTSVYFPGRVIPMLPLELSNGICSLNPHVDRLSMVCEMHFNYSGEIQSYEFYRGLMHSHARITYDEAWHYLDQGEAKADWPASVTESLDHQYQLFKILQQEKHARGGIEFNSTDVFIHIGEDGMVDDIQPYTRNDAHKLIENFMISANVCAAKFIEKHGVPASFRCHNPPPEGKIKDLVTFLKGLGVKPDFRENPTPKDLTKLLNQIKHREDKNLIEQVVLRSQSLATYEAENAGHFGLALTHYAHFTSPIRRYPDLMVHRAIDHIVYHKNEPYQYSEAQAIDINKQCSMTERRAETASREVDARLKCLFMQQFIGDEMSGTVSGVTRFGLFVQLENYQVDGLIHVTSLPNDYYHYDGIKHQLTGERGGNEFRLTDHLMVKIAAVDLDDRRIDFEYVGKLNAKGELKKPKADKSVDGRSKGTGKKPEKPKKGQPKGKNRRRRKKQS